MAAARRQKHSCVCVCVKSCAGCQTTRDKNKNNNKSTSSHPTQRSCQPHKNVLTAASTPSTANATTVCPHCSIQLISCSTEALHRTPCASSHSRLPTNTDSGFDEDGDKDAGDRTEGEVCDDDDDDCHGEEVAEAYGGCSCCGDNDDDDGDGCDHDDDDMDDVRVTAFVIRSAKFGRRYVVTTGEQTSGARSRNASVIGI